ncbi:MAG: efflux RND transporter permease subunit [Syntrophales bacterium]|nr:efflux RND transporter permease subunit [Syntrophales bacterium]
MISWIIRKSLGLRFLVVIGAAMLVIFGMMQIRNMPVDVYPEFAPPRVEIQTLALGLSAADVEALVTVPIEEALNGVEGLDVLRSRSIPDLSSVLLIFKPGVDLMKARLLVQERVREATSVLPIWASAPFMIQPLSSTSRVMKIGLSVKDKSTQKLIDTALTAYWSIRPRLMRVPGVANVAIWGDRWNVLLVQADPKLMNEKGVSLINVMESTADALDVGMFKFSSGHEIGMGGFIDTPEQRYGIRHILPYLEPEQLAQMPVDVSPGHKPVTLGDVSTVIRDIQPHLNGDAIINEDIGLMMIVEKLPWGNTLEITRGVEEALAKMAPGLPGIEIDTQIFRPATFIEESISNLSKSMLFGCILVIIMLAAFLYEWRVTLISVVAIPLSLITAVLVLYFRGASINTMVLAGLVIALGAVVDDAIIDIENIVRRLRQYQREEIKKPMAKIILEASMEIRGAVIYSSLIEIAALAPIFFTGGLTGSFFKPLALSYCLAIAASTVTALTVTPAMALLLMTKAPPKEKESPIALWLQAGYKKLLVPIISRPIAAYVVLGVVIVAGLSTLPFLGEELFPAFKERDFLMHWVAKPGTSHPEMLRICKAASKELLSVPGVRNFGAHIGQGTLADEPVGMNFAENWISLDKSVDYDKTVAAVKEVVGGYPGLYRDVQTYLKERTKEVLTGTSDALVVRIFGDNLDIMRKKAEEIKTIMSGIDGIIEEHIDLQIEIPQLQVEVDLAAALQYGIKPGDVRRAAATFIASEEAGDIWKDGKNIEVHIWSTPENRNSIESVSNLLLDTKDGRRVRLGDLATVQIRPAPNVLLREDSSRRMDIAGNVYGRDLGSVARELKQKLTKMKFPLGYHAEMLGEYQERQRAQNILIIITWFALFAILLILHESMERNWRLALMVMLLLPVAMIGGIIATGISSAVISLGSLVGFLTILGIATRNGILMISHFRHLERYEGETFGPDLVLRGARERLSPILMTALTTALALIPLVVAGTVPGHEIEYPTAVVILGGLTTSTLINLFVVPSLYLRFGGGIISKPENS